MSELTDKAHEVGSLRHARDLLEHHGQVTTKPWWAPDGEWFGRYDSKWVGHFEQAAAEQARAQSDQDPFQKEPRP